MIRPFHPPDVVRCALLRDLWERNRAYTLGRLAREEPDRPSLVDASRGALGLESGRGCSLVWTEGYRVKGLVIARQRSGPLSWEVAHLLLSPDSDGKLLDLLEKTCQMVGRRGGERLFIRLLRDDPLVDVSRFGGFFPCVREAMYSGRPSVPMATPALELHEKRPGDEHDLFRLYHATTPSDVRCVTGMTLDQWRSSRERTIARAREFVYKQDGVVKGWLSVARRGGVGQLSVVAHHDKGPGPLVDHGLRLLERARVVHCLVPEFEVALTSALKERGFQATAEYITLVKVLAVRAKKEEARAPVTIASV